MDSITTATSGRVKPFGFKPRTEYVYIKGLNKEEQKKLLKKFLKNNNLSFNDKTKNANVFDEKFHYKYILPHVVKYYQKMEEQVPELLKAYHPNYKIFTYQGHNIMRTEKFGKSLDNDYRKSSSDETIKKIMRQFLDKGFYHGDLYTEPKFNYSNVLKDDYGNIKLIDFGLVEIEKNTNKNFQTLFRESEMRQLKKEKDRTRDDVKLPPPTPARRNSRPINRQNLLPSRNLNKRRINQQNFNIKTIFKVDMSCDGCSNAIGRILKRINGVTKFNINKKKTSVEVFYNKDIVTEQEILSELKRWGAAAGKNVEIFKENQNFNTPFQILRPYLNQTNSAFNSPSNSPPNSPSNSPPNSPSNFSFNRLNFNSPSNFSFNRLNFNSPPNSPNKKQKFSEGRLNKITLKVHKL